MAAAGWYPDPSGQPGAFRYWDGAGWGETLADHPYGPPPGGATPPPPPPPGGFENTAAIGPLRPTGAQDASAQSGAQSGTQPGTQPPPPPPPPRQGPATPAYGTPLAGHEDPPTGSGRRTGRALALVLLAILVTLVLGVASFLVVRGLIEDDAGTASSDPSAVAAPTPEDPTVLDPSTDATDDPPGDGGPTTGAPVEPIDPTVEQCTGGLPDRGVEDPEGGLLAGGGLAVPVPDDFAPVLDLAAAFTFADGVTARSKVIEQSATSGWVAVYTVGGLSRGNGFDSPQRAAQVVAACMTQSSVFYSAITGLSELGSSEVVLDGRPAWELTQEVRIDDPELTVEGDVLKVVVVDTGDEATYGLFLSVVPIGDRAMLEEQDAAVEALRVP